jgi:hypothetical protein
MSLREGQSPTKQSYVQAIHFSNELLPFRLRLLRRNDILNFDFYLTFQA